MTGPIPNLSHVARLFAGVLLILCCCAPLAWNQGNIAANPNLPATEYGIKAAFLLNFVKFVEWPATAADQPLEICLWRDDPFSGQLDTLVAGERINGRRIVVRRIQRWPESCQVLFISQAERDTFRLLSRIGNEVLTVGEEAGFLRDGGMINFVIEDRRVRFDVNQKAADEAGVRINARLMGVARRVLQ